MNSMKNPEFVASPVSGQASHPRRLRAFVGTGLVATLRAMAATTLVAALAKSTGVVFEVPDGGETIPCPGSGS